MRGADPLGAVARRSRARTARAAGPRCDRRRRQRAGELDVVGPERLGIEQAEAQGVSPSGGAGCGGGAARPIRRVPERTPRRSWRRSPAATGPSAGRVTRPHPDARSAAAAGVVDGGAEQQPAGPDTAAAPDAELRERERPPRALRAAPREHREDRRRVRVQRRRQQRLTHGVRQLEVGEYHERVGKLDRVARERFDGDGTRRERFDRRGTGEHVRNRSAGGRCALGFSNLGMTSGANRRRLSSTSCCGIVSPALRMKFRPSTPIDSHRLIASTMSSGSPIAMPSGAPPGRAERRSWRAGLGREVPERLVGARRVRLARPEQVRVGHAEEPEHALTGRQRGRARPRGST